MVDHNKAMRNEDYFEQYRRKQKDLRSLKNQMEELELAVSNKRNQMSDLKRELEIMRRIITAVIDQDIDPTEARLRGTDDLFEDMWDVDTKITGAIGTDYGQSILLNSGLDTSWATIKLRDGY
jgi:chromosome segregation ATPase